MPDVGNYPFKQAAHYTKGRTRPISLIVLHDMEAAEKGTTAESVATYFARPDSRVASAHLCVDSNSVVRCVHDADTAYGAKSANNIGLHVEHAGYAKQTGSEWLDAYGRAMLELSARAVARWCVAYKIPVVKLNGVDLKAGKRGICGHKDVSDAWPSTGHTDPGPGFPWDYYLQRVKANIATLTAPMPVLGKLAPPWFRRNIGPGSVGSDVRAMQAQLKIPGRLGGFGPRTFAAVKYVQHVHGLPITGRVDRATAIAIGPTPK